MGMRDSVIRYIDKALESMPLSQPEDWGILCHPFCYDQHDLTSIVPRHKEFQAVIYQAVTHPTIPTLGVIACGDCKIRGDGVQNPIYERIEPALGAMAFSAILTTNVGRTYSGITNNAPLGGSDIKLSLTNPGIRLRVDGGLLQSETIERVFGCLVHVFGPLN